MAAITPSGIRFGKGHGYFDLEWAMLYTKGIVDLNVPVVAVGGFNGPEQIEEAIASGKCDGRNGRRTDRPGPFPLAAPRYLRDAPAHQGSF